MENQPEEVELLLSITDEEKITKALAEAVRDALRKHKALGNPVAAWRDGKVVWIPPEEISIPPE
ncbi:MAG TPA: hypothetical protein V6D28_11420 [Leptolyngbyaceae cyanobacterium]